MTRIAGLVLVLVLLPALSLSLPACDSPAPVAPFPGAVEEGALVGLFEGRFPCDTCQRLKTGLALLQDPTTRAPSAYAMREIYVGDDDLPRDSRGTWSVTSGAPANPEAPVYVLQPEADSAARIYYLRFDDNLLLLLDQDLNARVGNASHSFTLSRTR